MVTINELTASTTPALSHRSALQDQLIGKFMPQVAITDFTFPSLEVEQQILGAAGCDIISGQCRTPAELISLVAEADAVITQFAPVDADVIAAMQRARVIVRYGIGFDNVACDAARDRGIPVCNIPDYCIDEVADHTLAFVLACTRGLRANCARMEQGQWGLGVPIERMQALRDLTVGIVGLGRIGRAVADRLVPFKCQTLACDPVATPELARAHGCRLVAFDELLGNADIVTLHCPSTRETRQIMNGGSLDQMKPGSILINVGRGDLVDLAALTVALQRGHLAAAALDVFDVEPLPGDDPLPGLENVIVSSHVASVSPRAVRTLRETAARTALAAIRGEALPNVVNGVP